MNTKTQVEQTFSGDWITKRSVFEQTFNVKASRVYRIMWAALLVLGLLCSLYGWYKASQTYKIEIKRIEPAGPPYW